MQRVWGWFLLGCLGALPTWAETGVAGGGPASFGKFPWYGSLKKTEINVRSGPGSQYPILWIYQRPGYPVQVLTRYDNYYRVRDVEGEEGWVYVGMVSRKQTALVGGKVALNLLKKPTPDTVVLARLAPGVMVEIEKCQTPAEGGFCEVRAAGWTGWVGKRGLLMVD
jgi:SH3-like domain-containing protein